MREISFYSYKFMINKYIIWNFYLVKKILKFCLNYHLLELYCSIQRSSNKKLMYPTKTQWVTPKFHKKMGKANSKFSISRFNRFYSRDHHIIWIEMTGLIYFLMFKFGIDFFNIWRNMIFHQFLSLKWKKRSLLWK